MKTTSMRLAFAASIFTLAAACAAAPEPTPAPAPSPEAPPAPETGGGSGGGGLQFSPSGDARMDVWRRDFAARSIASGRSAEAVTAILTDLHPLDMYLGAMARKAGVDAEDQAEFSKPIWDYLESAVSESRKSTGAEKLNENPALFDALEARYGVDRQVLLAIWGMETHFGGYIGDFDAANTLANMAVEGRRRSFAESELTALIKLVEMGVVERGELVSGWAGAMGQTQFMPSTYLAHAEDFEGDGKKDVWNNPADALASAAHYLASKGYRAGEAWGIEVSTPPQFDFSYGDAETKRSVDQWEALGLVPARGGAFDTGGASQAELWLPAGADGPKFLLFDNFNVFKTYNRADSYALAIGLLSDGVMGVDNPVVPWPTHIEPLSIEEVKALQTALNRLGYDAGTVDGIAGRGTRRALQKYQMARGFVADGQPTKLMLAYVTGEAG